MKRFWKDTKRFFLYVIYAGQTELRSEVADSYLNWLWWIIEPLCFMFIYSFVFGTLFGASEVHFNCFVFVGITMWDFFNRMLTSSVQVVRNNKAIVSKVYIPKYMLIFTKLYVNAFKMMISFGLLLIMMIVTGVKFTWYILLIIPTILVLFVLTFGICTFMLHFGVFVDDLANVTRIVLRMLFYLTGVFYNLEDKLTNLVGPGKAKLCGQLNPIASVINAARDSLLYGKLFHWKYMIGWFIIGLILSALGIRLIYKSENSYVKVI